VISKQEAYIFIGPPGAGKGSLSKLCIEQFGWTQLSTGNLCRKHIAEDTHIGKQIDFTIKSGKLISDELITDMVDEWLGQTIKTEKSLILDGFPRNIIQAKSLFSLIRNKYGSLKVKVVRFLISDDVAVSRICNRYICQNKQCQTVYSGCTQSGLLPKKEMQCDICEMPLGRRDDDSRDTVVNRLKVYRDFEKDMLDCLQAKNELIEVDMDRPLNEIFDTFKNTVADAKE
jgi:adenylate kinase